MIHCSQKTDIGSIGQIVEHDTSQSNTEADDCWFPRSEGIAVVLPSL